MSTTSETCGCHAWEHTPHWRLCKHCKNGQPCAKCENPWQPHGTAGILDGEFPVVVVAWGCEGSADTIIIGADGFARVHACRVEMP